MNTQAKKDEFIRLIAAMTMDGENDFIMENDDAVSTLNELIDHARHLMSEQPKTYTVVLLYPGSTIETYIESAHAETFNKAVEMVRKKAEDANGGDYLAEEFDLLAVFPGDLTPL